MSGLRKAIRDECRLTTAATHIALLGQHVAVGKRIALRVERDVKIRVEESDQFELTGIHHIPYQQY